MGCLRNSAKTLLAASLLGLLAFSCAGRMISDKARKQVQDSPSLESVFASPEKYMGSNLLIGGTIINSTISGEDTYIEVQEKPLDNKDRPKEDAQSRGRFIVIKSGKDSPFEKGADITVAGVLQGVFELRGDDRYPLIKGIEFYIAGPGGRIGVRFGLGEFQSIRR